VTRLLLLVLAAAAVLAALRRPALRPVAVTLAGLAAIDVARLWTSTAGGAVDVALVALWPGVVAGGVVAAMGHRRRWWLATGAAFALYAAAVTVAVPTLYPGTLRAPRLVAAAVAAVAWLATGGTPPAALPLLLLAAGDAVVAAVVWSRPWSLWWLARGLTAASYCAVAVALWRAARHRA